MNAEKLKKDLSGAIEMAQSIHDDMVEKFVDAVGVDDSIKADAQNITSQIATLVWYLEHVSEGVSA